MTQLIVDVQNDDGFPSSGTIGTLIGGGVAVALVLSLVNRNPYFRYEPLSGRIGIKDPFGPWRVYPRPGYVRLEYSFVHGEVREVAADGRLHRLPIGPTGAKRDDWRRFNESFHPEALQPVPIRPLPRSNGGKPHSMPPQE